MMSQRRLTGMHAFYALLAGQFVSAIGSGMTRFGLAVWVFTTTGDITAYTTLLFFAAFPVGLGALISGPLVDRWNRRRVMIVSDTLASLSTLVVAALFFSNALAVWHLYIALAVNGIASAFTRPAVDASVPLLVPKASLQRAAGLSQMAQAVEMIIAPGLAGLIVGVLGLGAVFVVDVVSFGISILALMMAAVPQPARGRAAQAAFTLWHDFALGLRYVRQRPALLYLLGVFAITMFLLPGLAYSLITPMVLHFASEEVAGLMISSFGVGSLLGGMGLTLWGGSRRRMDGMLAGMTAAGLAAIVISLREHAGLIGAGLVVTGISFVFIIGMNRVIWQTKAAPEMLGRVFSLQLALGVGAQSLGMLLAGWLAATVFEPLLTGNGALVASVGAVIGSGPGRGMALMFILVGLLELLIVLVSALMPSVRLLEDRLPDHDQAETPLLNSAPTAHPRGREIGARKDGASA